jgi:hypothetical protein
VKDFSLKDCPNPDAPATDKLPFTWAVVPLAETVPERTVEPLLDSDSPYMLQPCRRMPAQLIPEQLRASPVRKESPKTDIPEPTTSCSAMESGWRKFKSPKTDRLLPTATVD